jgi:hypothetical protein
MAIILRVSNYQLLKQHDWELLGNLLSKATQYEKSWRYVLDGVASFIEQYIWPSSHASLDDTGETRVPLQGVIVLADILLNLIAGGYPTDSALIEALSCLERLCLSAMFKNPSLGPISFAPPMLPLNLWERIVLVFYNTFTSSESEASRQAIECLQQITLTLQVDSVSKGTWMELLDLMLSKQPQIDDFDRRVRATDFLGKILLMAIPELSNDNESWDSLAAIVTKFATFIRDNLQAGRRNSRVSTLFESTVQTATNLSNVFYFLAESKDGHGEFLSWAGETLLFELEKVGAAGGSLRSSGVIMKAKANSGTVKPAQ